MAWYDWLFEPEEQERDDTETEPDAEVEPHVDDVLLRALLDGDTITREKALTLPAVSGAVDFICNCVASMPVKLYKYKQGKVEEIENDPRTRMLNGDTGDMLDAFQMKKAMVEDYLLGKGGYCYIQRYRNDVTGLFYVEERYIEIMKYDDPIYKHYQILVMGKEYKPYDFIKLLRNTKDGASGVGLTVEVSKALETAYQTLLYQLGMVKTGGNKKGFLKSQRKLGQDEINVLKQAWRNLYANNTENVVVLNNGLEFQEASSSAVETQLDASKHTLMEEINKLFHISDDFDLTFKLAIYPIVKAFETALNRDLLLEKEKKNYFFEFDVKEIIRASLQERYNAYKTAKETGFMTINEIRKAENMNYIEGLDVINVGLGAVLYNTETHEFFTPNTGETMSADGEGMTPSGGGDGDGNGDGVTPSQEDIDKMLEGHELAQAYDASGNSAERDAMEVNTLEDVIEGLIERFNPNHSAKDGRFTTGSGGGGGAWASKTDTMRAEFDGMKPNKKALYLYQNGFMSKDDALKHMKEGDIDKYGDEYFAVLKENGDYTPSGNTRDNGNRALELVQSGKTNDHEEARKMLIKQDTGFSDADVEATHKELKTWFGGRWEDADTATLDKYVASSPTYDGKIYRGMHFENAQELDDFAGNLNAGDRFKMKRNASWSSDEATARGYAHNVDDTYSSAIITCLHNKSSSPVSDLSDKGEYEVLSSSKAQWTVLRKDVTTLPNGNKKMNIYVVEADTDEP